MDLISKLEQLKINISKIEELVDDLGESLESKRNQSNILKNQIETNIKKIDEIIEEYNANSRN